MILTSISIWTWDISVCVVMCVQSHANVDNVIQGIKISLFCDYHLLLIKLICFIIQVASW